MRRKHSLLVAEGPELPLPAPAAAPAPPEPEPPPSAPAEVPAPVEGADVLDCPAHLLGEMPLATTLGFVRLVVGGGGQVHAVVFIVTTSRAAYAAAQVAGTPAFSGKELGRMAVACAMQRAFAPQLDDWLERKAADPAWVLSTADAVGVVITQAVPRWTIGQVFAQLGATLEHVTIEG